MGNSLIVPDDSAYEMIDQNQIRSDLKLTKRDKNKIIKTLGKRVHDLTEQLWNEEAKLEGYKTQNRDLAIMISILKAKEMTLKEENDHMRIINCLSFINKDQSRCSSIEFAARETQV